MQRRIEIVGVPMDLGADRRGVDMGPYAIRYAGLGRDLLEMGLELVDWHNLAVPGPESQAIGSNHAKYLPAIEAACWELKQQLVRILKGGGFPLILGGDHSIAVGTIAGVLEARGDCGVFWLDAHGDINTPETSPSGNVHGMPVAVILGLTDIFERFEWRRKHINPERLVLFGIRNLDPGEREQIRSLGIRVFTMSEIDQLGIKVAVQQAVEHIQGPGGIHLSLDMDAMDPLDAPGVATPWPGGLGYREAHLAMELLASTNMLCSMEVVEVNPIADQANRTGRFAETLILSALGKTIL